MVSSTYARLTLSKPTSCPPSWFGICSSCAVISLASSSTRELRPAWLSAIAASSSTDPIARIKSAARTEPASCVARSTRPSTSNSDVDIRRSMSCTISFMAAARRRSASGPSDGGDDALASADTSPANANVTPGSSCPSSNSRRAAVSLAKGTITATLSTTEPSSPSSSTHPLTRTCPGVVAPSATEADTSRRSAAASEL